MVVISMCGEAIFYRHGVTGRRQILFSTVSTALAGQFNEKRTAWWMVRDVEVESGSDVHGSHIPICCDDLMRHGSWACRLGHLQLRRMRQTHRIQLIRHRKGLGGPEGYWAGVAGGGAEPAPLGVGGYCWFGRGRGRFCAKFVL